MKYSNNIKGTRLSDHAYANHMKGSVCPYCEQDHVVHNCTIKIDGDCIKRPLHCNSCGKQWDQVFTVTGYEPKPNDRSKYAIKYNPGDNDRVMPTKKLRYYSVEVYLTDRKLNKASTVHLWIAAQSDTDILEAFQSINMTVRSIGSICRVPERYVHAFLPQDKNMLKSLLRDGDISTNENLETSVAPLPAFSDRKHREYYQVLFKQSLAGDLFVGFEDKKVFYTRGEDSEHYILFREPYHCRADIMAAAKQLQAMGAKNIVQVCVPIEPVYSGYLEDRNVRFTNGARVKQDLYKAEMLSCANDGLVVGVVPFSEGRGEPFKMSVDIYKGTPCISYHIISLCRSLITSIHSDGIYLHFSLVGNEELIVEKVVSSFLEGRTTFKLSIK